MFGKDNAFIQVLKIAPFRALWLSQLVSQTFLQLLFFSLMLRVYDLTRSNSAVAVMVFLVTLPNIFLGALAGVLVDHWGRKPVMFLSHVLRALAVLAVFLSSESLGWLYSLVFFISVVTQFFFPAEAGTIPELVRDRKLLLTANSLFSITFFGTVIAGNVLAGPSLLFLGSHWTFLLVAGAFILASLFTCQLPGKPVWVFRQDRQRLNLNKVFTDFMGGIDHLYRTPVVRQGIYLLAISQISIGILGAIVPGFADKVLGLPVTDVSLLVMAPAAAGMVLGAVVLGQFFRQTPRGRLIKFGFFVAAFSLIAYSLNTNVALSVAILLFLGAANAFLDVPVNTIIQENTPEEIRSRVYGVISSAIGLAGIFPIMVSGAIADMINVQVVMLFCGLVILGLAFLYSKNYQYHAGSSF